MREPTHVFRKIANSLKKGKEKKLLDTLSAGISRPFVAHSSIYDFLGIFNTAPGLGVCLIEYYRYESIRPATKVEGKF